MNEVARRRGKSKAPGLVREWLAGQGHSRCEKCSGDKWDVYHTPEHPCPKATLPTGDRSE